jgi:hypothetical protein
MLDATPAYLPVTGAGARSWIFRNWVQERDATTGELRRDPRTRKMCGKSLEMDLGSLPVITLAEARNQASEYQRSRRQGIDPLETRRQAKERAALEDRPMNARRSLGLGALLKA